MFAQGTSIGGQLAFNGLLPPAAAGLNVQLAACINQIGGGEPRCAATQNVAIAPDPIPTLAATRLKLNRKRAVTAPLVCAPVFAGTGCRGSIEIKTRRSVRFKGKNGKVRLARVRFTIPAGQTTGVKLTLARAQADLIRKVSRARAVHVIVKLDGKSGQTLKRVTLTR